MKRRRTIIETSRKLGYVTCLALILLSCIWQTALAEEPLRATVPFYLTHELDLRTPESVSFSFKNHVTSESSLFVIDTPEIELYSDRLYVSLGSAVQVRNDITEDQKAYLIPGAKAQLKLGNGVIKDIQIYIYGREFENKQVEATTGITLTF